MDRATTLALLDRVIAPPVRSGDALHVLNAIADVATLTERARAELVALVDVIHADEGPQLGALADAVCEVADMLARAEDRLHEETREAAEALVLFFDHNESDR